MGVSPLRGAAPCGKCPQTRPTNRAVGAPARPRHTWNTSGEGPPRAQKRVGNASSLLAASVDVVEADDVVLAEIAADLHLD